MGIAALRLFFLTTWPDIALNLLWPEFAIRTVANQPDDNISFIDSSSFMNQKSCQEIGVIKGQWY